VQGHTCIIFGDQLDERICARIDDLDDLDGARSNNPMSAYRSFAEQALTYFIRDHTAVPQGPVASPAAWLGNEMRGRSAQWTFTLSPGEIAEAEATASELRDRGVAMEAVTRTTFELPTLGTRLNELAREVQAGRGFVVLRGLPVARWGDELASYVFWGMGHHLGHPGAQNADDELLGHVTDYGENVDGPTIRSYRTARNIAFHCDAADAVALLCLRTAKQGGQSRIASSVAIFNRILATRPDLAERLFEGFALDRRGEEGPGEPGFVTLPAACYADNILRTFWHSDYFRSAPRHGDGAQLDAAGAELLDLYDSIAADPDVHLDMWLEPGDIQIISNHTVIHARTEYEDYEEADRRRHLLRLWLTFGE
jgi:hypothetical protein